MKLPLTLGDNAIHHTHGETEEDEIVQMIDLQTNSVQLTNSDFKINHAMQTLIIRVYIGTIQVIGRY